MENKYVKTGEPIITSRPNPFVKFLKRVFVYNIGYKVLAVALSMAIWVLTTGLA